MPKTPQTLGSMGYHPSSRPDRVPHLQRAQTHQTWTVQENRWCLSVTVCGVYTLSDFKSVDETSCFLYFQDKIFLLFVSREGNGPSTPHRSLSHPLLHSAMSYPRRLTSLHSFVPIPCTYKTTTADNKREKQVIYRAVHVSHDSVARSLSFIRIRLIKAGQPVYFRSQVHKTASRIMDEQEIGAD